MIDGPTRSGELHHLVEISHDRSLPFLILYTVETGQFWHLSQSLIPISAISIWPMTSPDDSLQLLVHFYRSMVSCRSPIPHFFAPTKTIRTSQPFGAGHTPIDPCVSIPFTGFTRYFL